MGHQCLWSEVIARTVRDPAVQDFAMFRLEVKGIETGHWDIALCSTCRPSPGATWRTRRFIVVYELSEYRSWRMGSPTVRPHHSSFFLWLSAIASCALPGVPTVGLLATRSCGKMVCTFLQMWYLRFSRQWGWRCCSGLWRRVNSQVDTKVSEKHAVSNFSSEDGDSMFLRNVGICIRIYTASQPRRATLSSFRCFYFEASRKL
jgi:hypothetical protein